MLKEQFQVNKFGLGYEEPKDFSTCWWQKTKQVQEIFIAYRTILMVYFLATLVYVYIWWPTRKDLPSEDKPKLLIYLTIWTYTVETVLFFLGFLVAVMDYSKQRQGTDEKLSVSAKVFWVVYTVVLPCAVMVTVTFWSFLYDASTIFFSTCPDFNWSTCNTWKTGLLLEHFTMNFPNVLMHALNSIFIFIDFWLVAFPYRFLHFYMPSVYLAVYVLFSVAYELAGGTAPKGQKPIYKILDWKEKPVKTLVFIILAAVAMFLLHILFSFLYVLKLWLRERYITGGK